METKSFDWVIIEDNKIRHRWECPDCDNIIYVSPWYYSEMGTPICTYCDIDAEYVRTEYNNA